MCHEINVHNEIFEEILASAYILQLKALKCNKINNFHNAFCLPFLYFTGSLEGKYRICNGHEIYEFVL